MHYDYSMLFRTVRPTVSLFTSMVSRANSGFSNFEFLKIDRPLENVTHVQLNRPDKVNAMNDKLWREIREVFVQLSDDVDTRCVVLSGNGRGFCAGIDLMGMADLAQTAQSSDLDVSRRAFKLRQFILQYQDSFTAIEKCAKPVIACVHGVCIGGGVDLITACDVRYSTQDALFSIREVDIGLCADVGTLQRLPKCVANDSLLRELVLTGRNFGAEEALSLGLVSRLCLDAESVVECGLVLAQTIASKSPVAVQGSKINLNYARDHSVQDGLEFVANWNSCHLQSEDLMKAAMASMSKEKKPPTFSKL